jgi:hypothetical protein
MLVSWLAHTLKGPLGALRWAHRDERGQALILTVGLFTVVFVAGVIAVDVGLWWAERRDSQTDADAAVLAGGQNLPEDPSGANDATEAWAMRNNVDLSEIVGITVDNSCFSDDPLDDPAIVDSVAIDVQRNDNPIVFGEVFGFTAPTIGAHAKACVGSLRDYQGLRPWAVSQFHSDCFEWTGSGVKANGDFAPLFGQDCVIRFESPSSQVGSIRLGDDPGDECNERGGGASKYVENILEGSAAVCTVGEPVDTEPGLIVGPTFKALVKLLSGEGECDAKYGPLLGTFNGIDDFSEAMASVDGDPSPAPSPDVTYVRRDCTSPRDVTIVIIDEFSKPTGFETAIMRGFAGFWIWGCEELDKDGNIVDWRPKCDIEGSARSSSQIRGVFINIRETQGNVQPLDPFGTRRIVLVE